MSKKNAYGLSSGVYAKLYDVWHNMNKRCHNKESDRYYAYGKRGIAVCEQWRTDFHAFARWALENGWEPCLSLERVDVDGMYCPENCTIITMAEQMRNKTNNVRITIDGVERCLMEWCEIYDVPFKRTWYRYKIAMVTDPTILFSNEPLPTARGRGGEIKHKQFMR